MSRWLAPAVCFGLAAYILSTLGGDGPVLAFVGLDRFTGPDPRAQSALTAEILLGLGTVFLLYSIVQHRRDRAAAAADDHDDDSSPPGGLL